jgi:multidrug efflux pump subunit AcrA (membrane-fusion protein)
VKTWRHSFWHPLAARGIGLLLAAIAGSVLTLWLRGPASMPMSASAGERPASGFNNDDGGFQQSAGVRLATVDSLPLPPEIDAVGTVRYEDSRITEVNLPIEGWIREIAVASVGQHVRRGMPLLTLFSQELDVLQTSLLTALRTRRATPASAADGPGYADETVVATRRRLVISGLDERDIREVERTGTVPPAVTVRSPADGVVVEQAVTRGGHVEAGAMLYRIADTTRVWVEAEVSDQDASEIPSTAEAEVLPLGTGSRPLRGQIVGRYPNVDPRTRRTRVRIEVANADGLLREGMFVRTRISAHVVHALPSVPSDAVLDSGRKQIVFVARGNGRFSPREVTVVRRTAERVWLHGIQPGVEVATRAAFMLDSDSAITAGVEDYVAAFQPSGEVAAGEKATDKWTIALTTDPDPPRAGRNGVTVTVRDEGGRPVPSLVVTVRWSMPAMPSMNMPEMTVRSPLRAGAAGVYHGTVELSMPGRWTAAIEAAGPDRAVVSRSTSIIAR